MLIFIPAGSLMTMNAFLNLSAPILSSTEGTLVAETEVLRESAR